MTALEAPPHSPEMHPTVSSPPCDFATMVQTHQVGVWRYLRYLGAVAEEADDLTQETFLAVVRSDFMERDACQTSSYLRTVARNQLLALRRKQRRDVNTVEIEAAERVWAASAGQDGSQNEYLAAVRECMEQLVGRPREAIELQYRDGASREAIAERLELKPDGVKTLLRRTRDLLRECVERKINRAQRRNENTP
jgi:RNA polymerase sigma-70 factor, ECF subfamily